MPNQVSINSTSEEVRDNRSVPASGRIRAVSINSTSEEVRDLEIDGVARVNKAPPFPLVPLPKKCVTYWLQLLDQRQI